MSYGGIVLKTNAAFVMLQGHFLSIMTFGICDSIRTMLTLQYKLPVYIVIEFKHSLDIFGQPA